MLFFFFRLMITRMMIGMNAIPPIQEKGGGGRGGAERQA